MANSETELHEKQANQEFLPWCSRLSLQLESGSGRFGSAGSIPSLVQGVEGSGVVAAVAQIQSLAWDPICLRGSHQKKRKKKKKKASKSKPCQKNPDNIFLVFNLKEGKNI